MVLMAALEANLTRLLSLTFDSLACEADDGDDGDDDDDDYYDDYDDYDDDYYYYDDNDHISDGDDDDNYIINDTRDTYSRMLTLLEAQGTKNLRDNSAPIAAFDGSPADGLSMTLTRARWRMVLLNPMLDRLVFSHSKKRSGTHPFSIQTKAGAPPVLTSASQDFLRRTFSTLSRLRHLKVGLNADNFLLCNLVTLLPSLESFVHVDRATFDPVVLQQGPVHSALKDLDFRHASMTPEELRAIVVAFPALTRLSIDSGRSLYIPYKGETNVTKATTDRDILEHSSLVTFQIRRQPRIDILRSRIRFPGVTELCRSVFVNNAQELQQLFWMFPALERYHSMTLNGNATEPLHVDEIVREIREYPIENLILDPEDIFNSVSDSATFNLSSIITQMPFLTQLWISGVRDNERTMIEVARNCKNIQELTIDLEEGCSQGLVELFVGCPKLRTCRGIGHLVLAEELIESAEWVCVELRELDIEIVGIPRLTVVQKDLLKGIRRLDAELFTFMNTNAFGIANQEEQDTKHKIEQIRQRLWNRGHELTPDETEAFEQLWISHSIQRKVYQRLARLTRLEELDFSMQKSTRRGDKSRRTDTLEFTLESGLVELGCLERLRRFSYWNTNHRIRSKEAQWIKAQWSINVKRRLQTARRAPRLMGKAR
ncbi:hypothetical protein BG015_008538 [Linnemannia schmuckeri]|uniref:Uncharacterized protein n=1 Tax=Linnemannia schmuckeri TaxID=64567 RepID=A0A9P5VAG6_9FUNG|nr:hypothetical protein BG015_008538 [Linnemannia schmuckeri]